VEVGKVKLLRELASIVNEKTLLKEGLGTAYEYFVKKRYLENLVHRLQLTDILEVHFSNGYAEGPVLTPTECRIIVAIDTMQSLEDAKSVCSETHSKKGVQFLRASTRSLPFNSNAFDLVLNSGDIVPEVLFEQVLEMTRVSKRFVLVFVPNRLHIGNIFFQLYLRLANPRSRVRHQYSMTNETLSGFFKDGTLTILERGGIDMPIWPSHLSLGGLMRRNKRAWNWKEPSVARLIQIQSALEDSLPKWIKAAQAHVVYVLGLKTLN